MTLTLSPAALTLRVAAPPDLAALTELLRAYYREGDISGIDSEDQLRSPLEHPDPGYCVAELHGELKACLLCRRLATVSGACECKRMFVAPSARRHGLASRLMDFAEELAFNAGFSWMYLDSKDIFVAAVAMYRKRGFEQCNRFNRNPEATLFFRKRLTRVPTTGRPA